MNEIIEELIIISSSFLLLFISNILYIPMAKMISSFSYKETSKHKRPGVIAKSKTSKLKSSKNYKKSYRGQGRV